MIDKEILANFAIRRTELSEKKAVLKALRDEFERSNADLINDIRSTEKFLMELDCLLRQEALKEFEETGSKQLTGGLGIRQSQLPVYDPIQAFDWANEHKLCLQLDTKAFETMAKANPESFRQLVTFNLRTTVTIPKEIEVIV